MKALMKRFWIVALLAAMFLLVAFPCLFGGLSAKEKQIVPSPKPFLYPYLKVGDGGITVEGVDFFQVVVGRVPYQSTKFSPILSRGEWWGYYPIKTDTLWFKWELNGKWHPSTDGKALFGPILADTLMVNDVTAIMQKSDVTADALLLGYALGQNYPNPFNPITIVEYNLPKASEVTLTIYNSKGQTVASLFNGRQDAGTYNITWDASQNSAGTYFLELRTSEFRKVIKMNLVR